MHVLPGDERRQIELRGGTMRRKTSMNLVEDLVVVGRIGEIRRLDIGVPIQPQGAATE